MQVHMHMRELGLHGLKHGVFHAITNSYDNAMWNEFSVLQAAHACEILIKSRIAEEHPLLIFEDLPKSKGVQGAVLTLEALLEGGKTYQYQDLPERLWATTGIELPNVEIYKSFGKLRNTIQHFAAPKQKDLSQLTLEFIYGVIDPFINKCWGLHAVDFNEDGDPYEYLIDSLLSRKILFLVSDGMKEDVAKGWYKIDWPKGSKKYVSEMKSRFGI